MSEFSQNFQMLLRGNLRHQKEHQHAHWLAVGRIEGHRLRQPYERGNGLVQALDAAMRYGNAMSERGRAKAFACKQAIEYRHAGKAVMVLEQESSMLEGSLLTGGWQIQHHVGRRQNA